MQDLLEQGQIISPHLKSSQHLKRVRWIFLCSRRQVGVLFFILLALTFFISSCNQDPVWAETPPATKGLASWYSLRSCLREGTSGIMANGKELKNDKLTCASWDYKFGTKLKITNLINGKWVIVEVCDRGPAKRLYRQGRIIDLSKKAFLAISGNKGLKIGLLSVKVEKL